MIPALISIIIPCYNSGEYLPDAIASVKNYPDQSIIEVIIVNDGSSDNETLTLLDKLKEDGYTVITQENKGVAAARNAGVKLSKGKYLLFLDSDNKIRNEYIDESIKIFDHNSEIGVVYGKPGFFGDVIDYIRFFPKKFELETILSGNYIDVCAVVRRKVWDDIGGFDEERILSSHADWEFWIRTALAGWKFHYIEEILYDYRIRGDSMVSEIFESKKYKQVLRYIYIKHIDVFIDRFQDLSTSFYIYEQDQNKPFRSFFKFFNNKYIKKHK